MVKKSDSSKEGIPVFFVQLVNSMTDVGKKVNVLIRGAIEWQKREKRKKLNPKMVYLKQ